VALNISTTSRSSKISLSGEGSVYNDHVESERRNKGVYLEAAFSFSDSFFTVTPVGGIRAPRIDPSPLLSHDDDPFGRLHLSFARL